MSKTGLNDFLNTLVDAAQGNGSQKRRKTLPTADLESSAFGYTEVNKLEHSGRMLQKSIRQILDVAPTLSELNELANSSKVDAFAKGELENNKLVKMAASLKTKYLQHDLPIFDEILKELVEADDEVKPNAQAKEAPKNQAPLEVTNTQSNDIIPLPEIRSAPLKARVFQHKSMSANKTYLDDKEIISQHNERLEFLGDSVLNTVVTKILYQRFPFAKEGQLSQMRSTLVCNKTLAEFSQAYNFHNMLRCNIEEDQLRLGRQKVYADIFEAYLGALAMERGYKLDEVENWLRQLMEKRLRKMARELELTESVDRNAKAELYALIGSASLHPQYVVIDSGDGIGSPFKVQCVMELEVIGEGEAPNTRDAGLRAAMAALKNKAMIEKFTRKRADTDRSVSMTASNPPSTSEFPLVAPKTILPNKFAKNEVYAYFGKSVGLTPTYEIKQQEDGYMAELKIKNHVISVAFDASKKNAQSRAATIVLQNKDKIDSFLRFLE